MKTILNEYRIHNADVLLRCDATAEDLIDVIEGNRVYIPCLYVLNKIDQISIEVCPGSRACVSFSHVGAGYHLPHTPLRSHLGSSQVEFR